MLMGLYKRGKTWFIDFYWPHGRDGKRHRERIGPSKQEASIILAERLRDIRHGINPALRVVKPKGFDDMVKEFEKRHVAQLNDQSAYGVSLRVLKRYFSGKTLQEITPDVIQRFTTD